MSDEKETITEAVDELREACDDADEANDRVENQFSEFGNELRRVRESRKESLRALARRLKISPTYLSDIERGKRNAPWTLIEKLEKMYD